MSRRSSAISSLSRALLRALLHRPEASAACDARQFCAAALGPSQGATRGAARGAAAASHELAGGRERSAAALALTLAAVGAASAAAARPPAKSAEEEAVLDSLRPLANEISTEVDRWLVQDGPHTQATRDAWTKYLTTVTRVATQLATNADTGEQVVRVTIPLSPTADPRAVIDAAAGSGAGMRSIVVTEGDDGALTFVATAELHGGSVRGRIAAAGDGEAARAVEVDVPLSLLRSQRAAATHDTLRGVLFASSGLNEPTGAAGLVWPWGVGRGGDPFDDAELDPWGLLGPMFGGGALGGLPHGRGSNGQDGPGGPRMRREGPGSPHQGGGVAESSGDPKEAAVAELERMGVTVVMPKQDGDGARNDFDVDWGSLAGYNNQKAAIVEALLLPLIRPDVYDAVSAGTRRQKGAAGSSRPRAILFEGPPGTGKTASARAIAGQAGVPLVYVPLETIVSKWFGESEKTLGKVFDAAETLGGALIFLDEVDALAVARGDETHEVSRRLLGVLLRRMDGFDQGSKVVVVAATNRQSDLDPALLSRFALTVPFGLPDAETRVAIVGEYAAQLSAGDRKVVAEECEGFAGRDIKSVCEDAERRWAAAIVRGKQKAGSLPGRQEYVDAARRRQDARGHPAGW
ncbi:unnamed protein product [Pedinophyceae sp. YPF-701]|nr:unnamed protein product [Pedinophyceae sp. YPF-701]